MKFIELIKRILSIVVIVFLLIFLQELFPKHSYQLNIPEGPETEFCRDHVDLSSLLVPARDWVFHGGPLYSDSESDVSPPVSRTKDYSDLSPPDNVHSSPDNIDISTHFSTTPVFGELGDLLKEECSETVVPSALIDASVSDMSSTDPISACVGKLSLTFMQYLTSTPSSSNSVNFGHQHHHLIDSAELRLDEVESLDNTCAKNTPEQSWIDPTHQTCSGSFGTPTYKTLTEIARSRKRPAQTSDESASKRVRWY